MARHESRRSLEGRTGERGELPGRRGDRAGGRRSVARERLQGTASAQRHHPNPARPFGGAMSTTAPGSATGRAMGPPLDRIDGPQKVRGAAPYAYEHNVENPLYLYPLHSAVVRGRVAQIDASAAEALPGVIAVISHHNAPTLADTRDRELAILQSGEVSFRGQYVGAVVAET